MTDVSRDKYMHLMGEVEDYEDLVDKLIADGAPEEEIKKAKETLAEKRNELTRISDGCGHPRPS
ncbi:MAG: hypothetical protein ACYTFY_08725 [Planctomycetota bacterium]|jgi:hypothetical protein